MSFVEVDIKTLDMNPCKMIGDEWTVVSSGKVGNWNCMTASWAHIGALWGKALDGRPTTVIYIRPSRFTDKFIDKEDTYTMCFFPKEYRNDVLYLGTKSGRDEDKVSNTKLTPTFIDGEPAFLEASLVLVCKKLYKGQINKEGFIEKEALERWYKDGDFHHVYIGAITHAYINK